MVIFTKIKESSGKVVVFRLQLHAALKVGPSLQGRDLEGKMCYTSLLVSIWAKMLNT